MNVYLRKVFVNDVNSDFPGRDFPGDTKSWLTASNSRVSDLER